VCAQGVPGARSGSHAAPGECLGEQLALVPHGLEVEARRVQVEHALAERLRTHTAAPGAQLLLEAQKSSGGAPRRTTVSGCGHTAPPPAARSSNAAATRRSHMRAAALR